MSARRTANKARERVRHQLVNWRRSSAYASRVRPRNPARNPARASRSGSVKAGWIVASAVDGAAVVIGHLPAGLEPGKAGPVPVPAVKRKANVSRLARSRYATNGQVPIHGSPPRSAPYRRLRARGLSANTLVADGHMRRLCAWWLHAAGRENGRRLRLAGWRIPARRIRPGRPREISDGHGPGRVQSSKRVPPGPGRPRGPRRYPGRTQRRWRLTRGVS
jgi:hypothetical protein